MHRVISIDEENRGEAFKRGRLSDTREDLSDLVSKHKETAVVLLEGIKPRILSLSSPLGRTRQPLLRVMLYALYFRN